MRQEVMPSAVRMKRVLNTGSGPIENQRLHAGFLQGGWQAVRLDIDPRVRPDLVGTVTDMRAIVPNETFDAVWSSHSLEHLHSHDVMPALREFTRVLRRDGFALITCPDLEAVASALIERGPAAPVYMSPAGPISPIDMLYGYRPAVAAGNLYMAHNTGFTADSLGAQILEAGFLEVHVGKGACYDLWAVACMPEAGLEHIRQMLSTTSESFLLPR